jgi:D-alanyl-D-alanine carboxypeptidase
VIDKLSGLMDSLPPSQRWLQPLKFLLMVILSFGITIALNHDSLDHRVAISSAQEPIQTITPPPSLSPSPAIKPLPAIQPSPALSPLPQVLPKRPTPRSISPVKIKLGHFPYRQADPKTLITVGRYGQRIEKLAPEAAIAWKKMVTAAREDNVFIIPISGFRSIETQHQLFYGRVRRWGSQEAAARVIAPPGYSEHHTGYVIDLGDGRNRNLDITTAFARSAAFRWLQKNSQKFGFELSFPPNNFQNISYEPWHWRFIGSPQAVQMFAAARNQRAQHQRAQKQKFLPRS